MKKSVPLTFLILLLILESSGFRLMAQQDASPVLTTPVTAENLDPAAFSEWVDGVQKPVPAKGEKPVLPGAVLQTSTSLSQAGLIYGDSKQMGVRYLRIGFDAPVSVGSVLVHGNGQLSVLKSDAAYPGNLSDDSQWIPAQRFHDGKVTTDEGSADGEVLWVLPSFVSTRALRFTHTAQPTDKVYGGTLGGAYVLSERLANLAPQAIASAQSMSEHAARLNNELDNGVPWSNTAIRSGDRSRTIAEDPEWVMLTWPAQVTINGLALLDAGFSSADVQICTLPANAPPGEATEADWRTVKSVSNLVSHYPGMLRVDWLAFDHPVGTRAIRLRLTAALDEAHIHSQLVGNTNGGKRVWLNGIMALESLEQADLKTALLPAVSGPQEHAPIAVNFTLPEDGLVTLVVEDSSGRRVRNLIAETPFPKGNNTVYWDGTDDLGRDLDAANHGLYNIPAQIVAPGTYSVRGLWHRPIDLRYEMSVYSPGNPPWPTRDGTGGWMTTHTPASSAVFVPGNKAPGGGPLVYLGCYVSEGGSALSWIDLDGNKIGGRGWVGGNWTGAQYLAYDSGANAVPGIYAYVGSAWKTDVKAGEKAQGLVRLTGLSASGDKAVLTPVYTFDSPNEDDDLHDMGGLAVHDGLLVFSRPSANQLVFVDARAGRVLGAASLPNPHGLAFDGQGRLLVLSDKSLLRFTLAATSLPLGTPETLVSNLEDPVGMTIDGTGNIYVSDWGTSNQVKVFSPEGKMTKTYGNPAALKTGPYDPNHMNNPKGMAVDSNGRLWVTEDDFRPKRVSVWNSDGTLWKAFYGPPRYGGGGALDSRDPTRFSYDGMEFHLDWDKGEATLDRVYYRRELSNLKLGFNDAPPEAALYFNDKRYLTDAYNSNPTSGSSTAFLFLDRGDAVVPVAAAGSANDWSVLKGDAFKSCWPDGIDPNGNPWKNQAVFIWSDLNGDGQVQPGEVKIWGGGSGGVTVAQDGSFLMANLTPPGAAKGHAMRFKPGSFTPQGVPIYDSNQGEKLAETQSPANDGGNQALVGTDGWTVLTTAPPPFSNNGLGGAKNGVALWSYPSLWPGLHASHVSPPPDRPGELIGTTRLLGDLVTPKNSDAGPLFFLNSNQGDIDVLTQDGLFVSQLFQDIRQGPLWEMPSAQRGMIVNGLTLHDENFFPTVTEFPDGTVHVMAGGVPALVKVDGLESIHRIAPVPVQVSASDLKLAQDFVNRREAARQAAQGSGILAVPLRGQPPSMDGSLQDWADAQWAPIDQRGVAAYFNSNTKPYDVNAAVTIAGGKLFAAWKTGDPGLLKNSGEIANALFKTGGALDLMIGDDAQADPRRAGPVQGDLRLLVSQVKGRTKALLYRPVVPGTPDNEKVPFSAPWHSITLDSVTDVSDQVQLASDGRGNYEIAAPLTLLGLSPRDGMKIKGDIGILRGDGIQTTQRVYWNNKATAIVSDVPSEAMLTPSLWGTWEFHSK